MKKIFVYNLKQKIRTRNIKSINYIKHAITFINLIISLSLDLFVIIFKVKYALTPLNHLTLVYLY